MKLYFKAGDSYINSKVGVLAGIKANPNFDIVLVYSNLIFGVDKITGILSLLDELPFNDNGIYIDFIDAQIRTNFKRDDVKLSFIASMPDLQNGSQDIPVFSNTYLTGKWVYYSYGKMRLFFIEDPEVSKLLHKLNPATKIAISSEPLDGSNGIKAKLIDIFQYILHTEIKDIRIHLT